MTLETDSGQWLLDSNDLWEEFLEPVPGTIYVAQHRRKSVFGERMRRVWEYLAGGVSQAIETLLEHELVLAVSSGLLVVGLILNVFAAVVYGFHTDDQMAFILGCLGTGTWMFALSLFLIFLSNPPPKHRRRR